jgi:hypothetical protein
VNSKNAAPVAEIAVPLMSFMEKNVTPSFETSSESTPPDPASWTDPASCLAPESSRTVQVSPAATGDHENTARPGASCPGVHLISAISIPSQSENLVE